MRYKIVVDSCCELPEEFKNDPHFEIIPLTLEVGDYQILDDSTFNQAEFLKKVAEYPKCPKSSCPSPQRFADAYNTDVEHVYCVTLSSHLSGSFNSAVLGKNLYEEEHGEKSIYVCDSESASVGETKIALYIRELEEQGDMTFAQIVTAIEAFRSNIHTYFVLDNLDTLRKNGRLTGVKSLLASTLSIKPVMAGESGIIVQKSQAVGIKKALAKMVDLICTECHDLEQESLFIAHCNCPDRATYIQELVMQKCPVKKVVILDTAGVSSMYANDGGVVVIV